MLRVNMYVNVKRLKKQTLTDQITFIFNYKLNTQFKNYLIHFYVRELLYKFIQIKKKICQFQLQQQQEKKKHANNCNNLSIIYLISNYFEGHEITKYFKSNIERHH